jgi:hypothetical protein
MRSALERATPLGGRGGPQKLDRVVAARVVIEGLLEQLLFTRSNFFGGASSPKI